MTPQLVDLIPTLLWFSLTVSVLVLFYRPLRDHVVPHLTTLNVMGVEFSFIRESMDRAIESACRHDAQMALAEKSKQWKVEMSPSDRERALHRARTHARLLQQVRLLWVDDHPENNENERRMFRQLGSDIDLAQTTEEALHQAACGSYDLVISDMERGDDPMAGLRLAAQIQQKGMKVPMVLYIGVLDSSKGVPPFVFGITNRPDELLHLVLDVLERSDLLGMMGP
ncbi:MAG: response regulator [Nitrospirae bacterium]|nr:MAG: response regulator [Nitrospirota bacterium]